MHRDGTTSLWGYIIEPQSEAALDVALAGGKGTGLARLIRISGIHVPEAFIIGSRAYEVFVDANGLQGPIRELDVLSEEWIAAGWADSDGNPHGLNTRREALATQAKKIREAIGTDPIPKDVLQTIGTAYERLERQSRVQNVPVAVRSSATFEDLEEASFAGQHATLLNQKGLVQVLEATRQCWASLFSDRAITYRNQMGFGGTSRQDAKTHDTVYRHSQARMAVVVQRMVNARAAGVGFNVHRGTGQPGMYLEVIPGLGEALVSGEITPARWFIDSQTWQVVEHQMMGDHSVLPAETILAIAASVKRIGEHFREHYGFRFIDTEFALDRDDTLWFLQARPETVWARVGHLRVQTVEYKTLDYTRVLFAGGITATPGAAIGRVRIIGDPSEDGRLRPGDVLVAAGTNPDWELLFHRAGAVITDMGGRTSHAAMRSGELGLPCIVAGGNAAQTLAPFEGQLVTCDATACIVYQGALPLVELPLAEALRRHEARGNRGEDASKEAITEARRSGVLREDTEGYWIGKPNYPLGRLQQALYFTALHRLATQFEMPLRAKVEDDVIYAAFNDLAALSQRLEGMNLPELEAILADRVEKVNRFLTLCGSFECTPSGLRVLFDAYAEMVAHTHLRWLYDRVLSRRLERWLQERPEYRPFAVAVLTSQRRSTIAQEANEAFRVPLEQARRRTCCFASPAATQVIAALETEDPDLLAQIVAYAENYTPVDRDDIREEPPIDRVVAKLASALRDELDVRMTGGDVWSPPVPDSDGQFGAFRQLLNLVLRQAAQKEDEHYLMPRGHWAMKKKLLDLAGRLVEQGLLGRIEEIFELGPVELAEYAGRVR